MLSYVNINSCLMRVALLLHSVLYISCQTSELTIVTHPAGADVLVLDPKTSGRRSAGKTPFTLKGADKKLISMFKGSDLLSITIEKKGYVVEHFMVDQSASPKMTLNIDLKSVDTWNMQDIKSLASSLGKNNELGTSPEAMSKLVEQIAFNIQTIQRMVDRNDHAGAYTITLQMIEKFPQAAILWDMRGSIELLRSQKSAAIKSFKQSLALKSSNAETQAILKKLEER